MFNFRVLPFLAWSRPWVVKASFSVGDVGATKRLLFQDGNL